MKNKLQIVYDTMYGGGLCSKVTENILKRINEKYLSIEKK